MPSSSRVARTAATLAPGAAAAAAVLLGGSLPLAGQGTDAPSDSARPATVEAGMAPVPAVRPVRLPELEVEARRPPARRGKMRGFDRRSRRHSTGVFVGRAEIERRDPRDVSDLLRGLVGVTPTARPGGVGLRRIRMDRTMEVPGEAPCRVRFFVDGVPMPKSGAFRVDALSPEDLEAVEIYRGVSQVPPRFRRRGDRCGTVVVWTRDPASGGRR